ncbi:MAG: DUF1294 domain-containing protein [Christensenella sp.]|nr:DUF1294 domain-containing protein [Christensenella sp.]
MRYIFFYFIIMNIIAFAVCGCDKRAAVRGKRRVPEKALVLLIALGGAYGFLIGMPCFRHKTRKWKFRLLTPLFCVLQTIFLIWLYGRIPF